MSGLKLAAFYGFAPHQLGLCGPREALQQGILKKFLKGKFSQIKIGRVLKKFKGAYPYYRLIARSNQIKNPFDEKVVSAYWVGNKLLDRVKIDDLRNLIIENFSGPGLLSKEETIRKANAIGKNSTRNHVGFRVAQYPTRYWAKPHHSFHVLVIGSVTGVVDLTKTKLKDLCRISWGRVIRKLQAAQPRPDGESGRASYKFKILVEYQPLIGRKIIKLGKPVKKEVVWDKEIVPEVKIGDWVSFHWDQLVQVLTRKDVANLKKYTINTLNSLS